MKSYMFILLSLAFLLGSTWAEQCGRQANGAICPNGLCCSQHGWCGTTTEYCGNGCQSQCKPAATTPSKPTPTPSGGGGDVGSLISLSLFNELLKHRDNGCPSHGFYTYDAFITAAQSFGGFGTTGDVNTRKRELAAFLAQTSHKTTGGWASAPDGPYAWGYCFIREKKMETNCDNKAPCPPGKQYYGRGPIQLTHNYNYDLVGKAIKVDLINNPDLVATGPMISFKTAIWFWMTPQANKPSSHDVIIGQWTPSPADTSAGRAPGYGVITNIINGGQECGKSSNDKEAYEKVANRIGFYKRYCGILGLDYGNNLDCYNQKPFG
ncbi:endochitinase-like isoform X2 [Quercus lobata]|uniref:chitinase n=1 Tax=Quercus lobata TaxID=97700 RepID=A0A7N2L345_QUELO|nr:endochitinase-like isoform X2 [Quercus lobata]